MISFELSQPSVDPFVVFAQRCWSRKCLLTDFTPDRRLLFAQFDKRNFLFQIVEVGLYVAAPLKCAIESTSGERLVRTCFFLHGHTNAEGMLVLSLERGKSFAEAAWAGEEVDYIDFHFRSEGPGTGVVAYQGLSFDPGGRVDVVDKETRSRMMSGIRGKDTTPEILVRKALHRLGFRFALHDRKLPGRPDLVLPRHHAVVFVHGCFWHRHVDCAYCTTPSTRAEFWRKKFESNVERDQRNEQKLRDEGWRVFIVWECGLKHDPDRLLRHLAQAIRNPKKQGEDFPAEPPKRR